MGLDIEIMKTYNYGKLTPHTIGIVMKELARRAIVAIEIEQFRLKINEKDSKDDRKDFVTSADEAAQAIYLEGIKENFPGYGIIAEEGNVNVPCTLDYMDAYFTIDALDGTRAFIRKQSHGIGTMISLVINNEVVSACVGDVKTNEIYYYRPEGRRVHRVTKYTISTTVEISIDPELPLKNQYVLLRDDPRTYSKQVEALTMPHGIFKGTEASGGSIGIFMARLWKGECGLAILPRSLETPWDLCPVLGITQKLGFLYFKVCVSNNQSTHTKALTLERIELFPTKETIERDYEVLIIHRSRVKEFGEKVRLT